MKTLIKNAKIVNENQIFQSDVLIENDFIAKISKLISEEGIDREECIQERGLKN